MGMRFMRRALLGVAALSSAMAFASAPATTTPASTTLDPDAGLQQVEDGKVASYRSVLAQYDAAIAAAPADAALAVSRCRFIGQFTDYESGIYVSSAEEEFEACTESLAKRFPDAPAAQLYAVQQLWGDEATEQGEDLLEKAGNWPATLRAALLAKVSEAQEDDNPQRSGELAVMAVQMGEHSRVAAAVQYLAGRKEFAKAEKLLATTPAASSWWLAKERVQAALALPDGKVALSELQRYDDADFDVDTAVAARAYLQGGDVANARRVLKDNKGGGNVLKQVRFDAALAANDMRTAASLVDLTDADNFAANAERYATLARHSPATLLTGPMLFATVMLVIILAVLAVVPGLALMPVHYRGLARRVGNRPAVPLFDAWGLRHAWFGAVVAVCVPFAIGLAVEPGAMGVLMGSDEPPEAQATARMMLWGTIGSLLCLVPVIWRAGTRQLIGDRTTLRATGWVLAAWVAMIAFGMLLGVVHKLTGGGGETVHTRTIQAMSDGGMQAYGPVVTFLLMAVIAPIFEELICRGLLLGGLSRHISFGWANTLQAFAFAAMHDDPPRIAYYFLLGLLAGWLVKKTRALGPAIALHILNNALASLT